MRTLHASLLLTVLAVGPVSAQNRPANDARALEGAWTRVEAGPAGGTLAPTGPGVMLLVDGHYSWIYINGTAPRPALPGPGATAEQIRAVYGAPIVAEAGTYEVSGQTMTRRPQVSKAPNQMQPGTYFEYGYRMAGDSLWVS